ncbi:MAG: hypothetical protein B6245_16385 [Desulfobacteraceae bacterium 4572_88]|nr:MAG: hypothetical protein B6245_16385 [Desulfobacteraceae bacterium 4572_88]
MARLDPLEQREGDVGQILGTTADHKHEFEPPRVGPHQFPQIWEKGCSCLIASGIVQHVKLVKEQHQRGGFRQLGKDVGQKFLLESS